MRKQGEYRALGGSRNSSSRRASHGERGSHGGYEVKGDVSGEHPYC